MASICTCGSNDVDHALCCKRGGYVIMRHNKIRDLTAALLCEVGTCVKVEPNLQPITDSEEVFDRRSPNVKENSRLDVKCKGFWNAMQDTLFEVRMFNPLASSYCNNTIPVLFKANERTKRSYYEHRVIEVEHGSFTPLVFAATGGMGSAATPLYKRLASMIAKRDHQNFCKIMQGQ